MEHFDNPKEAHLSKRRNRAIEVPQFHQPIRQKRHQKPELKIVNEDYVQPKARRVELVPKSLNQETYIDLLTNPQKLIIFATGPAGTGKTMLAVMAAIQAYQRGECKRIVITRPAVGVDDEEHGFLPGDLNAKMAPWTRPIMDVFAEYYRQSEIAKMLDEQTIEVSPLAFMRGRTFKQSWIIADEMQNATPNQMKMLLTRLGENSRMVVTGDLNQADRPRENGLLEFCSLFEEGGDQRMIAMARFESSDVERHPVVREVLALYKEPV
jgi:phosphate starvation-inducible PhoH-like protein